MKEKPGQHAAQSAPGVATISLQPRQSGGSTASSSLRPASAQIRPSLIAPIGPGNCAVNKGRSPTSRHAFALHTGAMAAPDPLLVFDRAALRLRRERAVPHWDARSFLKREIAERLAERL